MQLVVQVLPSDLSLQIENDFGADFGRVMARSLPSSSGPPAYCYFPRAWGTRRAAPYDRGVDHVGVVISMRLWPPRLGVLEPLKVVRVDVVALEGVVERLDVAVLLQHADPYVLHLDAEDGHGLLELAVRTLQSVVAPHANPSDLVEHRPLDGV